MSWNCQHYFKVRRETLTFASRRSSENVPLALGISSPTELGAELKGVLFSFEEELASLLTPVEPSSLDDSDDTSKVCLESTLV